MAKELKCDYVLQDFEGFDRIENSRGESIIDKVLNFIDWSQNNLL